MDVAVGETRPDLTLLFVVPQDVSEARRLRSMEEENSRLKRLVADQAVQIQILKEVNSKKW